MWRHFCHFFSVVERLRCMRVAWMTSDEFTKLKAVLTDAFSLNAYSAYEAFVSRRYIVGETVDVYLSELRRLARLVCATVDDSWIKCAFVAGLPDGLKRQLKAASSMENITLASSG